MGVFLWVFWTEMTMLWWDCCVIVPLVVNVMLTQYEYVFCLLYTHTQPSCNMALIESVHLDKYKIIYMYLLIHHFFLFMKSVKQKRPKSFLLDWFHEKKNVLPIHNYGQSEMDFSVYFNTCFMYMNIKFVSVTRSLLNIINNWQRFLSSISCHDLVRWFLAFCFCMQRQNIICFAYNAFLYQIKVTRKYTTILHSFNLQ